MVTDIAWERSAEFFNEDFATVWEFFVCVVLKLQVFLKLCTFKTVGFWMFHSVRCNIAFVFCASAVKDVF
jgi:hypothetical protein